MKSKIPSQIIRTLWALSPLEIGRIQVAPVDLDNLAEFKSLETLVSESMTPVSARPRSRSEVRVGTRGSIHPELAEQLLQVRNRVPLSSRILRPGSGTPS